MNTLHDGVESVNSEYRIRLPKLPSLRKPKQHIRIYFNNGKGYRGGFQVGIQQGGAIVETLGSFDRLIDAGDFAYGQSLRRKMAVKSGELTPSLVAAWERQGADCYREGVAIEYCENPHRCRGWNEAYMNDPQPLVMYGWPTAEGVTA